MTRSEPLSTNTPGTTPGAPGTTTAPQPTPVAIQRTKTPLPAKPKSRPRKLLTPEELLTTETKLREKYPHIVPGTLLNATKGETIPGLTPEEINHYNHKRSCIIKCEACDIHRRIATSDLAQVKLCPNCTRNRRNTRKRARRALTRTIKHDNTPATHQATPKPHIPRLRFGCE